MPRQNNQKGTQMMSIMDVIDGLVLDDKKWKLLSDRRKQTLERYYEEYRNDSMLMKILRLFPDCKVYMRGNHTFTFRVVYTEDGIEQETILYYDGSFQSGHKPKFNKPPRDYVNQNGMLAIYQRIVQDPMNILLNQSQMAELRRKFKDKPLGKFLGIGKPKAWLMSGETPQKYRVLLKNHHDINNAWDMTFSMSGDVVCGNYPYSLSDDKSSEFKSGMTRILSKHKQKSLSSGKEH